MKQRIFFTARDHEVELKLEVVFTRPSNSWRANITALGFEPVAIEDATDIDKIFCLSQDQVTAMASPGKIVDIYCERLCEIVPEAVIERWAVVPPRFEPLT